LWDDVHSILATNSRTRGNMTRAKVPFLLKGIVFGKDGRALTTSSSVKKKSGRRYRYYLSTRDTKEFAGASGLPRIPAAELEAAVVNQIRSLLQSPPVMQKTAAITRQLGDPVDEAQVTVAMMQIDKVWDQLFPDEQSRIIRLLVEKVIVTPDSIDVRLRSNGIERLALEITDSAREEAIA
jgi:hypothetical protein